MNLPTSLYRSAARKAYRKIGKLLAEHTLRGLEAIMQDSLCSELVDYGYRFSEQALLEAYGGRNLWENSGRPRVDILIDTGKLHAIELKVIQLPEYKHSSPKQRLWNLGQITSDYWRIKSAKNINTGELGILVVGELVGVAKTPKRVLAEFHNAMYLDFVVSSSWGELRDELDPKSGLYRQRKMQFRALKEMGFSQPFSITPEYWLSIVTEDQAYIRIPIKKR